MPTLDSIDPRGAAADKSADQVIAKAIAAHIDNRVQRLQENFSRVSSLVRLSLTITGDEARQSQDDVLRSAVVLLHAALEDFLRGVAASHLPLADETALNQIPLAGMGTSGRPEKFFLGRLTRHRGKTVDQVISESVEQSLEQSNFNNARDIAALLGFLNLDVAQVQSTFPQLDVMMKRRHQIVHRADRVVPPGGGPERPEDISAADVVAWMATAVEFETKLLTALTIADLSAGRLQIDLHKFGLNIGGADESAEAAAPGDRET